MIEPAKYDESVVYAFRALFDGVANEGQQKRAMEWLLLNACHIGMLSYVENDRDHAFLEGQRSIGLQIAKLRDQEALKAVQKTTRTKRQEAE